MGIMAVANEKSIFIRGKEVIWFGYQNDESNEFYIDYRSNLLELPMDLPTGLPTESPMGLPRYITHIFCTHSHFVKRIPNCTPCSNTTGFIGWKHPTSK